MAALLQKKLQLVLHIPAKLLGFSDQQKRWIHRSMGGGGGGKKSLQVIDVCQGHFPVVPQVEIFLQLQGNPEQCHGKRLR